MVSISKKFNLLKNRENKIVGIVPMAGNASRLGKLPFSKELYPITYENGKLKVAADHLISSMVDANASQINLVIRNGKWDIPTYFQSTYSKQTAICYHIAEYDYGVPFTVNQAYPFFKDDNVILGFPDILFKPENACKKIIDELLISDATVILGLFPVSNPAKFDMVQLDNNCNVQKIIIKPTDGKYRYAWIIAAWKPVFSKYLNRFVESALDSLTEDKLKNSEIYFGDVIISALNSGIKVKGVKFESGNCVDIGTPNDLAEHSFG